MSAVENIELVATKQNFQHSLDFKIYYFKLKILQLRSNIWDIDLDDLQGCCNAFEEKLVTIIDRIAPIPFLSIEPMSRQKHQLQ